MNYNCCLIVVRVDFLSYYLQASQVRAYPVSPPCVHIGMRPYEYFMCTTHTFPKMVILLPSYLA